MNSEITYLRYGSHTLNCTLNNSSYYSDVTRHKETYLCQSEGGKKHKQMKSVENLHHFDQEFQGFCHTRI